MEKKILHYKIDLLGFTEGFPVMKRFTLGKFQKQTIKDNHFLVQSRSLSSAYYPYILQYDSTKSSILSYLFSRCQIFHRDGTLNEVRRILGKHLFILGRRLPAARNFFPKSSPKRIIPLLTTQALQRWLGIMRRWQIRIINHWSLKHSL